MNQGETHTEPFGGEREGEGRESIRDSEPRVCSPFVRRGSAIRRAGLHPSLRPVRGSTSLLEASQKGAFLTPDRVTPRVHQSGASRPTPLLSHSSEKQVGELGGKSRT